MGVLIVDYFSLEGIHAQLSGLACPRGMAAGSAMHKSGAAACGFW